jgi:8-oxo-dGTP pyrophosphatase MutT (NUDIX family)
VERSSARETGMSFKEKSPLKLNFPVPIVSAIIERERDGQIEVLVQTRWKLEKDPKYSGTLEIPAGGIGTYENVYDALRREVFEETGLTVIGFKPDIKTKVHTQREDEAFAFVPFCCQQQTKGKPRIGLVFVCTVDDKEPVPGHGEVKDIRWVRRAELKRMLEEIPEKVFTFQLGALDYYLNYGE